LDYFKCTVPKEVQTQTCRRAIDLALELNRPLILHCRDAFFDLIPILKSFFSQSAGDGLAGVVHCFTGTLKEADELLSLGFFLGVDGPLTYPKAQSLQEVMNRVPLEKILLETDSPYLPPQPYRGQRNEPSYLPLIGVKLAEVKSLSIERIARQTYLNACRLFRLNPTEISN